jgi:serine/threonine protein kinase
MTLSSPVAAPPRLARYELLEEIGHGAMATVWRARDAVLGREVAVKETPPVGCLIRFARRRPAR